MRSRAALIPLCLILAPPAAEAKADNGRSRVLSALVRCQTIASPTERLACYDGAVRALDEAETKRDVVVIDRAQVNQTRRTLFGLALPRLAIFGDGGREDDADEVKQIESTIARADLGRGGAWTFTLADGANWRQIDDNMLGGRPRVGDKIVIRRAALGSFKASIAGQPAIKVRREN